MHDYISQLLNEPNFNLKSCLQQVESSLIKTALLQNACNQTKTAAVLGIGRSTLVERIQKYQININEIYASYKSITLQNMVKLIKNYPELKEKIHTQNIEPVQNLNNPSKE